MKTLGCDTLVMVSRNNSLLLPCKVGYVNVPKRDIRVIEYYSHPIDELVEKAKDEGYDIARFIIETDESRFVHTVNIRDTPVGGIVNKVVEKEGEEKGVKYRVVKETVALCEKCPLNVPNRFVGIIAPPCSIRTRFYEEFAPSLLETIDKEVKVKEIIDTIIKEAEEFPDDTEEKKVFLSWAKAVKEHLGKYDDAVIYTWC